MRITLLTFLLVFLLGSTTSVHADKPGKGDNGQWKKELRDFKLKFLAQEMELREDQQKQFFTLYNQMMEEKEGVMRQARKATRNMDNATEDEYRQANETLLRAREQDLAIEKRYDEKFRTFLTQKQIFKMKDGERKFRDKLHELRHNRPPRPSRGCNDK